jgi:hypothetical protein
LMCPLCLASWLHLSKTDPGRPCPPSVGRQGAHPAARSPHRAALKTFTAGPHQRDGALLEKMERDLAQLKDVVSRVEGTENEIRYSFDSIERHIDDALRGAVDGIYWKLSAVDAEMDTVKAKVRAAYNLPLPGNGCCRQDEGWGRSSRCGGTRGSRGRDTSGWPWTGSKRGCVLCLAAFPEGDVAVKKRLLIHWWIAEGFVGSSTEGSSRFQELVDKGFVTPLPKPHCDKIHQCKLPPLVLRDMLAEVAGRSAFLGADLSTARRAMLLQHGRGGPLKFNPEVRAIYNMSQKYVLLSYYSYERSRHAPGCFYGCSCCFCTSTEYGGDCRKLDSLWALVRTSREISNYMLFLLVMRPFMMTASIGQIRFGDTCAEAKNFFRRGIDEKQAAAMLSAVRTSNVRPRDVKGDRSKSVLFDACRLAEALRGVESPERRWRIISGVWAEMLCYSAGKCRGNFHAKQLSQGGEVLTMVWLLMAHMGMGEQYRVESGHARAKLIIET